LLRVYLKVQPSSSKRELVFRDDGTVKAYLNSAPENNKANKELVKYLAEILGISKSSVKIIKGHKTKNKVVEISGLSAADFSKKIKAL